MKKYNFLVLLFSIPLTIFLNSPAISQNAMVTIGGEVEKPLRLDAAAIKKMNHVIVKAISHADHKEYSYGGIPLSAIIRECGAIPGNQLRGKYLAKYILVGGSDGYNAVIALPETDTAFTDKVIILADEKEGKALPADVGPFQLIVPGDKRPARSVWHVVSINILSAKLN